METKMKSFNEMRQVDLGPYVQKKPTFYRDKSGKLIQTTKDKWLDYVEWAVILDLLYKNGANRVEFFAEKSQDFPNTLVINLTIDGNSYKTNYPIIEGNTVANNPNQLQIHKAEMRGFVKCVAIHTGLGLNLWMKEEKITSEYLTEESTIKVSAKSFLEQAKTMEDLIERWNLTSEDDQVKYKDVFSDKRKEFEDKN